MRLHYLLCYLLISLACSVFAQNRLALVVGNKNYTSATSLRNPINDANDVSSALRELGFTVITRTDLDLDELRYEIDEFGERLKSYDVGLFYYSGHGIQANGVNYLLPTDADPDTERQVEYQAVKMNRVLGNMDAYTNKTNIIILDACRDNPFTKSWTRSANDKGFKVASAPSGTLIAYSAAPGTTASDGVGRNGLYTGVLLTHIKKANVSINDMFIDVRSEMRRRYGSKQTPWESSSLTGRFYFNGSSGNNNTYKPTHKTPENLNERKALGWRGFTGYGEFTWPNGDRYVGDWVSGFGIHGKGTFYWGDPKSESYGNRYVGDFKNGAMHGKGTHYYKGGERYEGDFVDNIENGQGTFYWNDPTSKWYGDKYVGDWVNGDMTGLGTYYYKDGTEKYGRWNKNKYVGKY